MAEEEQSADHPITEVEITVAGHTIIVKAAAPLADVEKVALSLYRKTRLAARKIPFGFAVPAGQIEKADTLPDYSGPLGDGWEEDRARLGGKHQEGNPSS